jgi:hypothetical protein
MSHIWLLMQAFTLNLCGNVNGKPELGQTICPSTL